MNIELIEPAPEDVLHPHEHGELWLRVQSNEIVDLARVVAALTKKQCERLQAVVHFFGSLPKPCAYFPHLMTAEERRESGYRFEDWFIFERKAVMI